MARVEDMLHTYQPSPEALYPVPGHRLVVHLRLDLLDVRDEVHLLRAARGHAFPDLRANVEDGEEDEGQVVRDERRGVPVVLEEHGPSAELEDAPGER